MAIFIRLFFSLIGAIYFSFSLHAQSIITCSSCETPILHSELSVHARLTNGMSIFKCPQQLANLRAVYKWGVSDQQGNVIVSPNWDSIGGISNHLVEVFQYLPQRKRAPLRAGLISTQQKIILPVSYRSIQLVKGTYYRVNNGKGFQLWKADKGFVSTLSYDSIISSAVGILLYTESFCHRLDSISNKINQGPYREWLVNDNNRIYATVYDTLYIYRNGDLSLTPLLTDSIGGSSRADEIVLYRNNRKVPFRFEPSQLPAIKEMDPIHPAPLSTLLDSTLIKIKFRTQADSLVLVDDWFLYRRKNLWGYGDTLGNIGVGAQYEELRYKHNKRLAMKYKGKWGFVDDRENFILQPYYDEVGDFIDQGTWIRQNKKYNFIDLQGKILNSNWYESISLTAGNNYLVQLKGKMGLVGKDGREKIGTRYLQVLDFGGGSCLTQTEDGKWFLMDYAENRISKYPYSNVKFLRKSKVYVLMK